MQRTRLSRRARGAGSKRSPGPLHRALLEEARDGSLSDSLLQLGHQVGNAQIARLLADAHRGWSTGNEDRTQAPHFASNLQLQRFLVQRCGPVPCDCTPEERQRADQHTDATQSGRQLQRAIIQRLDGPCEDVPPRSPRHLVIRGSVHPDVRDAQRKLNLFHTQDTAAGGSGIGAPLVEDCIFGSKTFDATVAFQKRRFPKQPEEHDGKIGDKTWAELDKLAAGPAPVPPPVPVPPSPPIKPPAAPACKVPTSPDRSGTSFNPTTDSQAVVAAKHPIDAISAKSAATDAFDAAGRSGLLGAHLGPQDAFRHCVWNCLMTQRIGALRAEQFATGHENSGPSSIPFDNQMDLHDNATGRLLGSPGTDCEAAAMSAVAAGELRTIRRPPSVPSICMGASDQPWP